MIENTPMLNSLSRRSFLRYAATATCLATIGSQLMAAETTGRKPNVLFIYIDDLNDWVGYLRGHPQAQTPNIDRLAKRGVAFRSSLCPAPMCFPSRTATLTGRYPSATGMYGWNENFRMLPDIYQAPSLPQYFRENGWLTYGADKVFGLFTCPVTPNSNEDVPAAGQPPLSWTEFGPAGDNARLFADKVKFDKQAAGDGSFYPYGPAAEPDEKMGDYRTAAWIIQKLNAAPLDQPVFLVPGFRRPHAPFIVPQKWFDLYPLDQVQLPEIPANDLDDIGAYAKKNMGHPAERAWFEHWRAKGVEEHKRMVQAYLACVSFVDHCVGQLLDALDASPRKDNTYVVLIGDNGFNLGQKGIGGKWNLWHEGDQVPLIVAGPGLPAGKICEHPVDHVCLYPTLAELCGLPIPAHLDGVSLVPLLHQPDREWTRPALCTKDQGNHNLRTKDWSYIRYADGSEELYDRHKDPQEYTNLAGNPENKPVIEQLKKWLPATDAPPLPVKHRNQ